MSDNSLTLTINLPAVPDVPGLTFRHFRGESDYAGIREVFNAANVADGFLWVASLEDVEREYTHLVNSDPTRDMIIAEIDGTMVGYVRGQWTHVASVSDPTSEGEYRHWFQPFLLPVWRGRGIRRALIRWIELRMGEVAQSHPAGSISSLDTFVSEKGADLSALLLDEGFTVVRYFDHMVRQLADPIPDTPLPPGLELRPVRPEHYRAIWDASNEAMRDHYNHHEADETEYENWLVNKSVFRPELWQIAWDTNTDEVAGQVRSFIDDADNVAFNRRRGYSEFISVRQPYRRLGLARALVAESLRVLKAAGMDESALTVDSENISGAARLYADCGFVLEERTTDYRKLL